MSKNARDEARREREFYARQARCAACGRELDRRKKGWACSIACRERLQSKEGQASDQ